MEGSVAAGGHAGDGGAQQQQSTGDQGGTDFGAAIQEMQAALKQQGEFLQSQPWQQQQQQDGPTDGNVPEGMEDLFLDPGAYADPADQAMAQQFNDALEQRLAPIMERLQQSDERSMEALTRLDVADLVGEMPELGDEATAKKVVDTSHQLAANLGYPELGNNPRFWKTVFMASKAADIANQEGSEQPGAAHLEGGSGATPGSNSQVDLGDAIVNAGSRARLPFG